MTAEFNLHPPGGIKVFLEKARLREVTPADICPRETRGAFYEKYPDLLGDRTAIGIGDDGRCQSWRGDWGWWREFVE